MKVGRHEVVLRREFEGGGSDRVELSEALKLMRSHTEVIQVHVLECSGWMRVQRRTGDYDCWEVSDNDGKRVSNGPRSARGGIDRAFRELLKLNRMNDPGRDLLRWKVGHARDRDDGPALPPTDPECPICHTHHTIAMCCPD